MKQITMKLERVWHSCSTHKEIFLQANSPRIHRKARMQFTKPPNSPYRPEKKWRAWGVWRGNDTKCPVILLPSLYRKRISLRRLAGGLLSMWAGKQPPGPLSHFSEAFFYQDTSFSLGEPLGVIIGLGSLSWMVYPPHITQSVKKLVPAKQRWLLGVK